MKDVWVDLLCFSSAMKILFLSRKVSIDRIYYINADKILCRFLAGSLKWLLKVPVVQVDWVVEADEKIGNASLYELIKLRIADILDEWVSHGKIAGEIKSYCMQKRYDPIKFKEHLRINAYRYLFRSAEMMVISEKFSGRDKSIYIFRRTHFSRLLGAMRERGITYFYTTYILFKSHIADRPDYFYDSYFKDKYFFGITSCIWHCFLSWFQITFNSLFYFLWDKISGSGRSAGQTGPNIGVELIQSRVRLDVINDIYWLRESGIDPRTVCGIELENYDEESSSALSSLSINRYKMYKNPLRLIYFIITGKLDRLPYKLISAGLKDCLSAFPDIIKLFSYLFCRDEEAWMRYQQAEYRFQVCYWNSIYRQLGLKIIWSMFDVDDYKLAKSQAIELCGGLYAGSHWSVSPMHDVHDGKCYDVFCAWGIHFIKNIHNRYPSIEAFQTGYPLDFYFDSKRTNAISLRNRYPGKFILSYNDNAMANDIGYSSRMQLQIYRVLISMIKKYDNVVVFLKPKRKRYLDMAVKELPEIERYIGEKRVEVFLGDTPRTKFPPAEVGMASDLVIGLGISTAATECYFAGSVSFYADLTGYEANEFGNNGLNKVVFRDIKSMERAIQERITGENTMTHDDYRVYYEMLDPFQDGKAYIRTGFIVRRLQDAFRRGLSRKEAVRKVKMEYDAFISGLGRSSKPVLQAQAASVKSAVVL